MPHIERTKNPHRAKAGIYGRRRAAPNAIRLACDVGLLTCAPVEPKLQRAKERVALLSDISMLFFQVYGDYKGKVQIAVLCCFPPCSSA